MKNHRSGLMFSLDAATLVAAHPVASIHRQFAPVPVGSRLP
jgi:hypothetical protein